MEENKTELIYSVANENGKQIEIRFKPIKGKKQLKMLGFLAQILGGDFIKSLTSGKGLDMDIKSLNIDSIVSNLSDKNIDKLTDKFCSFVVAPPLHKADEDKRDEFFDQFELSGLMQMMVDFVMMSFNGSFPETQEIQEK